MRAKSCQPEQMVLLSKLDSVILSTLVFCVSGALASAFDEAKDSQGAQIDCKLL